MNRQHECMLESEHVTTTSKIKGLKFLHSFYQIALRGDCFYNCCVNTATLKLT